MARVFDVTSASTAVRLDALGQGKVLYTATNKSGRPLRGRAALIPEDAATKTWLSLSGEAERDFPPDGVQQFEVKVAVPAGTKSGACKFRLDLVSVENPDEDIAQGPTVEAAVTLRPIETKRFPSWMLVVAAVVVLVVVGVVAYGLKPKMVDVPNVMTKTASEADDILKARGFKVEQDPKEDPTVTEARVIAQEPAEGRAQKGSTMKLTIAVPVPPLKLDDYVGKNIKEVRDLLERKFRKVAVENQETGRYPAGTIMAQQPAKDAEVKVGETVTLTIAVPRATFPMPPVTGKSVWTAKSELEAKGLKVSVNDQVNPAVPHEQVTGQDPLANAPVKSGDRVELTYAITLVTVPAFSPPVPVRPIRTSPPRYTGVSWKAAENTLNSVGLTLKEVRGSCDALTGFVTRTNPPAGSAAPKGMAVTVFTLGAENNVCYTPKVFLVPLKEGGSIKAGGG